MSTTREEIAQRLGVYVSKEDAEARAEHLFDDMAKMGFDLQFANDNPHGLWLENGTIPQAEYRLPKSTFDINSENDDSAMSGSFLTLGNLLRLSQCVELARRWIPDLWIKEFGPRLLTAEHLDALTEIWWLKLWRGIVSVERGPKLNKATPDFEWLLRLRDGLFDCQINLEVKRRPGNLNQSFKSGKPGVSPGRGIDKKFGPVADNVANVVAFTIFVPITEERRRRLFDWLDQQPHIHGLLVWTEGHFDRPPLLKRFKSEKRWAGFLVSEPEPEDLKVAGRSWGTLCRAEELPEYLKLLAAGHDLPHVRRLEIT